MLGARGTWTPGGSWAKYGLKLNASYELRRFSFSDFTDLRTQKACPTTPTSCSCTSRLPLVFPGIPPCHLRRWTAAALMGFAAFAWGADEPSRPNLPLPRPMSPQCQPPPLRRRRR